jgi:uncharacterized protein YijF (DUF1287 family)
MQSLLALVLAAALAPPSTAEPTLLAKVLAGAHSQIGVTVGYDPTYRRIPYPGGDVPIAAGVCTDVIVRAYRQAEIDLQKLVHEDMARAFDRYPQIWGLRGPDANIDHRRVPNLATFFARHGTKLPVSMRGEDYEPGDIVTWRLASGVPHIGLVADEVRDGRPLMIHNIGGGSQLEDVLFAYTVTGHYRYRPGG